MERKPGFWTRPYCGVQHLQRGSSTTRDPWCTVTDYGSFATSFFWFPGCGFLPTEQHHDSADLARAACEAWLSAQP